MSKEKESMTIAEMFAEASRVAKMIEGTSLRLVDCVKLDGVLCRDWGGVQQVSFTKAPEYYTFALTLVEGKPAFKGDVLYSKSGGAGFVVDEVEFSSYYNCHCFLGKEAASRMEYVANCTWERPKPATLQVELLFTDVEVMAEAAPTSRTGEACRKALANYRKGQL